MARKNVTMANQWSNFKFKIIILSIFFTNKNKLAKIETIFTKTYQDQMPSRVKIDNMDLINKIVFGTDTLSIYLQVNIIFFLKKF